MKVMHASEDLKRISKQPLGRTTAIFLAILVMWFLGGICLGLMHSIEHWSFILLGGYDAGTLGQIGGYYLARVGSQVPAIGFAALIVSKSDLRHPVGTACLTTFAYHGTMTAIRIARHPWSVAPNCDQSIALLAEIFQLLLIVVLMAAFARLAMWLRARPWAEHFN